MNINRGLLISILSAVMFGLYPVAAKKVYQAGADTTFVILFTTVVRTASLVSICIFNRLRKNGFVARKSRFWRWVKMRARKNRRCIHCDTLRIFSRPHLRPAPKDRISQQKRFFPQPVKGQSVLPSSQRMIPLILGGACQFGSIWGILSSVRYIPAPITIIIMFLHTIMLLGYTAYKKEISWEKSLIVVTLVALLGVSFVVDVWAHSSRINWIGVGFAFFAALMTAVRLYVFGKEVKLESPTVVGAQVFSVSTACVLLYAFFNLPIQHPDTLEGLLWAVMCAGALSLGTYGMFLGIAELGAFQWSLMAKLEPMCTVGFAFLILGEALHGIQYLGMLLILGALISYQLLQHNRKSC